MPAFQKVRVAVSTKSVVVNMDNDLWKKGSFADESVDVTHLGGRSMILKKAFSANGSGYLNLIYGALQNTSSNTTKKIASMIEKGEAEFVCESKFPVQTGKSPIPVYKSKASVKGKNAEMFVEIVGEDKVVFHCNVLPFGEASEFKGWCERLRTFYANTDTEKGARKEAEAKARKEAAEKKAREEAAEKKALKEAAEKKALKEAHKKVAEAAAEKAGAGAEAREAAYKKMREEEGAKAHKRLGEMYKEEKRRKVEETENEMRQRADAETIEKLWKSDPKILFLKGGYPENSPNGMQTEYKDNTDVRVMHCSNGLIFYPSLSKIPGDSKHLKTYAHEVYILSQAANGKLGEFNKYSANTLDEEDKTKVINAYRFITSPGQKKTMEWEAFLEKKSGWVNKDRIPFTNQKLIELYIQMEINKS